MKIKIKVHSNSSTEKIEKIDEKNYEIWIKERAEKGKANPELIKLLKRFFKSDVSIKSGFKSKNKVIEIK